MGGSTTRKRISISTHKSTFPSLIYVVLVILFASLLTRDVHSWTLTQFQIRTILSRNRSHVALNYFGGETQDRPLGENQPVSMLTTGKDSTTEGAMLIDDLRSMLQLFVACMGMSIILISWEDISMPHSMRTESSVLLASSPSPSSNSLSSVDTQANPWRWGRSTVRGLAFGGFERQVITAAGDLESSTYENLPSYNEVMLTHRMDRIPLWNTKDGDIAITTTRTDVMDSVRAVQLAVLQIRDCEKLARDYEWDELIASLNDKVLRSDLQNACYILKRADEFLSREARDEIGFDWGSCAWRHCGALSDAQEAIDALEHQVGMLEPFECVYCLDVVERSLRDILAVTNDYRDTVLEIPDYVLIQRMSDAANQDDILDAQDTDYMNTLSFLRNSEF